MKRHIRKSFFNKKRDWFIAYALILLLPIVFNFISFSYTESVLEEKVKNAHILSLSGAQNYIDNTLSGIVNASLSLSENSSLSRLSQKSYLSNDTEKQALTNLRGIWQMHDIFSSSISHKLVYFPKSDSAYVGNGIISASNLYKWIYGNRLGDIAETDKEFSAETFRDRLLSNTSSGFIAFQSGSSSMLFYSVPVSEYTSDRIDFNIIIEISLEHLLFQSRTQSGADFYIGMPDGTILSDSFNQDMLEAVSAFSSNMGSFEKIRTNGKTFVVMQTISSTNDWTYGTVMPIEKYRQSLPMTRELTFICIMVGVLLGIALIYWLTDRTYTPLKNISELFKHSDTAAAQTDIFTNIRNSVENILDKNETLADRVDASANTLKTTVLTNIIYGKTSDKLSYTDQLGMLDIKPDGNMFSVILVGAENNAASIFSKDEDANLSDEEKSSLSKLIIGNIIHELLSEKYFCEVLTTDAFVVFLVNYSDDIASFKSTVGDILERAGGIIENEFSFRPLSAVSNAKISLDTVSSAYREAVLCFEHIAYSDKTLLFYEDIISQDTGFVLDFPQFTNDIKKALNEKNYAECREIIKSTIYNIQQTRAITPEMAQIFACDLLRVIMNSGLISASDKTKALVISAEYDRIMSESSTVSNILLRTMNIIDSYLRDYIEISDMKNSDKMYELIKEYIDSHYGNPELSATQISEQYGLSSAYLSTQFKKKYGLGVLDYIRNVRIEQAKLLLKTSDMSNEDIAACVGYMNTRTFLRAFQKIVGITPKEFRKTDNADNSDNTETNEE